MGTETVFAYFVYCAGYGVAVGLIWAFFFSFVRWRLK